MSDNTKIEWTDATWSPVTGCTKVSPGCDHCYIDRTPPFRMNGRAFVCPRCGGTGRVDDVDGNMMGAECARCKGTGKAGVGDTTGVRLHPERLEMPLRWKRPRRIFVCSLADLFHHSVPDEYIARVFAVMAMAPQHTFQVLTKRHARLRSLLSSPGFVNMVRYAHVYHQEADLPEDPQDLIQTWPLPNVHLGVTVEDQARADLRIPALLDTPAAVRWLSCEPLLGPVDLSPWRSGYCPDHDFDGGFCIQRDHPSVRHIDWVVVGGESGPNARPMHPEWARTLRDQCAAAGIPFLFKQWGEWAPAPWHGPDGATHAFPGTAYVDNGQLVYTFIELDHSPTSLERNPEAPAGATGMRRVGKKAAGRELDGRTWDEHP